MRTVGAHTASSRAPCSRASSAHSQPRCKAPSPYTLTEGTPGATIEGSAATREVVVGKRAPSSRQTGAGGVQSLSSGPPWYGSHLTVGKRP
jgi:hypothetical protein